MKNIVKFLPWNKNRILQAKLEETQETVCILTQYKSITEQLIDANKIGMSYVPMSDWVTSLRRTHTVEKHTKEQKELIRELVSNIATIAEAHNYKNPKK